VGSEGKRNDTRTGSGSLLRATSRGALVLETEHARRMMQKLRNLKDDLKESVEPDAPVAAKPASPGEAGP
jgi:hypothetical protein